MQKQERLVGCILAGAIGDAWGSGYENLPKPRANNTLYLQPPPISRPAWQLTDDTQLTLVTLEALCQWPHLTPAQLAAALTNAYGRGLLTGLGASTLRALRELRAGGNWSQVGRAGEYGAGNGAAMRMAPFAFWEQYSQAELSDFCRITHHQPDSYAGALAVVLATRASLAGHWMGTEPLLALLLPQLPDTRVRDRLLEIQSLPGQPTIADVARLGTSGYVVDSVPFALFCASQVPRLGLRAMLAATIAAGGDADTNASLARQVAGALLGQQGIPAELLSRLKRVAGYDWLQRVVAVAQQSVSPFTTQQEG